ncbi:MAG: AAA family ATPase [Clostridia bacterium]|nr:AAA family ATPase [Clostridia bacterium]
MEKQNSQIKLTFELHSLFRDVLRNFWAIICAALIALMGLYIVEHSIYKPEYTSSSTLVVRAKSGTSGAYTSFSAAMEMASIFTEVFEQPSVRQLAAENLGEEKFNGTVSASVHEGTNLMTLSVTADDPELAYKLLSSILEVYPNVSDAVFSNSVIDIMVSPQMPTSPSNRISKTSRKQIAVLAAAAMGMLIVLLSLLRDTVKNESSFKEKIDSKLIGTIAHEGAHLSLREQLRRKKRALLINDAFSSLRFYEDYQKIVTKLEYMHKNNDSKVFTITSVAENEGKSTAVANIAIALAGRGYRVMLVDLDVRKPAIYKIFEYQIPFKVEFSDVLSGKVPARQYKFLRYKKSNLLIAMNKKSRMDSVEWIGSPLVKNCISVMRDKMDFVIIDTPPVSASADAMSLVNISDKTMLVVRTDYVSSADINDTILTLSNVGGRFAGCILNDVYRPFTMFGQIGADESGSYTHKYSSYKRYAGYGKKMLSEYLFDMDVTSDKPENSKQNGQD